MSTHSGQCLCGDVSFVMEADLTKTGGCHCNMCRAQNGGAGFYGVMCDTINFKEDAGLSWYKSSDWAERGFCKTCGTTVAWRLAEMADQPVMSIGTLDDASAVSLKRHIFTDEAAAFAPVPENAPHVTGAEFLASIGQ